MKEKFVISEYHISADKKVPTMAIALVSDLHEKDPEAVLSFLRQSHPDMICVTGDTFERHDFGDDPRKRMACSKWKQTVYDVAGILNRLVYGILGNRNKGNAENAYRFLREAEKIAPVFISIGNHEWYLTDEDRDVIHKTGVRLLDNEDCEWKGIHIGGLSSGADINWLTKYRSKDGFKVLLCHHPEYYERYKLADFDLVLSGHVHGGQWRIAGRGVFAPDQGMFPKYSHGVYDGKLVVSAGCSNTTAFPRFGNPCEVVLVFLHDR